MAPDGRPEPVPVTARPLEPMVQFGPFSKPFLQVLSLPVTIRRDHQRPRQASKPMAILTRDPAFAADPLLRDTPHQGRVAPVPGPAPGPSDRESSRPPRRLDPSPSQGRQHLNRVTIPRRLVPDLT